ncbi:MAG: RHS repeat-associated core domain-containing protein [Parabacteroides sp.]|nr:RHS repeat-associated core domain-containing protein [Parabacteroides sp.]
MNSVSRSPIGADNASGSMQGAGGVGGLLMVNAGSGGVHFPAYDLNGNVMGLVNATNGIISTKYEYGPFGEVFCSVGDMAKVNPFQFSTKYTDNETDLVYYGYRYYSPALGRWLSRDPIEEKGGLNLYGFVNNDPVNKWDVLGLKWKIIRNYEPHAYAYADSIKDTFDSLARKIHLDTSDYKKWANTTDDYVDLCACYKIPNTIYIEIGDNKNRVIRCWANYFKQLGEYWKIRKFNVVTTDPSSSETFIDHLESNYIYGLLYAGHGGKGGNLEFSNASGVTAARFTKYGIHFLYLFGCSTATKNNNFGNYYQNLYDYNEWELNVAKRGYFQGITQDANWYTAWDYIVDVPGKNPGEK